MNVTFFDLETTDKEPTANQILTCYFRTLSLPEYKLVDECYLEFKPVKYRVESFAIHGISEKEAKTFPDRWESFEKLLKYMAKHKDSLFCCHANHLSFGSYGYFDEQVIRGLCFEKSFETYLWFQKQKFQIISTHTIAKNTMSFENYRQETIANGMGIKYKAHKAKSDVMAMVEIFKKLVNKNTTKKQLIKLGNYNEAFKIKGLPAERREPDEESILRGM